MLMSNEHIYKSPAIEFYFSLQITITPTQGA